MQSPLAIRNVSCGAFEESASSVRKMRSIFRTLARIRDFLIFWVVEPVFFLYTHQKLNLTCFLGPDWVLGPDFALYTLYFIQTS